MVPIMFSGSGVALWRRRYLTLLATAMASFITPFTTSSVTLAFPRISMEFSVGLADVNWVTNSFLVALASSVLAIGRFSDYFGRGRVFVVGLVVLTLTSITLSWVRSYSELLILRFIQGIASAMISATAIAIISDVFPRERRGLAIGVNTAAVYLGLSLGPLVGGYVIEFYGWRTLFVVKVVIALLSLVVALSSVDLRRSTYVRPSIRRSIIISLLVALTIYGASSINTFLGLTSLSLGLVLLIITFIVESRNPEILHPSLLTRKPLAANLAALLNYSATFAIAIALSNYLQKIRHLHPSETGLLLTIQPLTQMILSPLAGSLADRYEPSTTASVGMLIVSLGLSTLLLISPNTPLQYLTLALAVLGVGFAFFASPNTTAIMNMSPKEAYASASALLATMRFLGQSLSTSVMTSVMSFQRDLMDSIRTSLTIYIGLSIIGVFLSLLARGGKPRTPKALTS